MFTPSLRTTRHIEGMFNPAVRAMGFRLIESGLMPGDKVIIGGLQRIYSSGGVVLRIQDI